MSGIVAAVLLSRVLKTFLFDVKPTDPVTLSAVGVMFVIVASLASGFRHDAPDGSIRSKLSGTNERSGTDLEQRPSEASTQDSMFSRE